MSDQSQEIEGVIKFYSQEKGYGFIGTDETDYFFTIHCFKGKEVPVVGRKVLFIPSSRSIQQGKRPKVTACRYDPELSKLKSTPENKSTNRPNSDSRVKCPHCGKLMVPRMWLEYGRPSRSYCPFCGETYKDFNEGLSPLVLILLVLIIGGMFVAQIS